MLLIFTGKSSTNDEARGAIVQMNRIFLAMRIGDGDPTIFIAFRLG